MIALFAEVWFGVALFGLVVGLLFCFCYLVVRLWC